MIGRAHFCFDRFPTAGAPNVLFDEMLLQLEASFSHKIQL